MLKLNCMSSSQWSRLSKTIMKRQALTKIYKHGKSINFHIHVDYDVQRQYVNIV